jgi:hypothetical protein
MSYSKSMMFWCTFAIPLVLISSTSSSANVVTAWVQHQHQQQRSLLQRYSFYDHNSSKQSSTRYPSLFSSTQPDNESISNKSKIVKSIRSIFAATTVLTVGWWSCSIAFPYLPKSYDNHNSINPIVLNVANAKEMASGSGSRVNKDPESLLRYGLPIQNKEVRI